MKKTHLLIAAAAVGAYLLYRSKRAHAAPVPAEPERSAAPPVSAAPRRPAPRSPREPSPAAGAAKLLADAREQAPVTMGVLGMVATGVGTLVRGGASLIGQGGDSGADRAIGKRPGSDADRPAGKRF
jgi:hypothetical protein